MIEVILFAWLIGGSDLPTKVMTFEKISNVVGEDSMSRCLETKKLFEIKAKEVSAGWPKRTIFECVKN
jgi:hypothetical protein